MVIVIWNCIRRGARGGKDMQLAYKSIEPWALDWAKNVRVSPRACKALQLGFSYFDYILATARNFVGLYCNKKCNKINKYNLLYAYNKTVTAESLLKLK